MSNARSPRLVVSTTIGIRLCGVMFDSLLIMGGL